MPQLKLLSVSHVSRPTNLAGCSSLLGCSILIVEDEPLIALDLYAALCAAGAGIVAATDAREALRLTSRNEISAAVMDVKLGDHDCLEVCQALLHRRVPFVFHTGHAEADLVRAWPEVPVLIKPASPHEVVACVAGLVN